MKGKKRAMNMQQIDPVQMEKYVVITSYLIPKVINDAALKKITIREFKNDSNRI